ncbi:MAG TPA: hypothetical protein VHJ69_10965 [Gemmatimonadales bacterium]|nr:hypothetical protein [Gemmatimonadales bacterium]
MSSVAQPCKLRSARPSHWLGGILAAVYAALYARFAAQWTHLAGLYNQIKAAEVRAAESDTEKTKQALANWKAGFIEDADALHLATKPMFAVIIRHWLAEEVVRSEYLAYGLYGQQRLPQLEKDIARVLDSPRAHRR